MIWLVQPITTPTSNEIAAKCGAYFMQIKSKSDNHLSLEVILEPIQESDIKTEPFKASGQNIWDQFDAEIIHAVSNEIAHEITANVLSKLINQGVPDTIIKSSKELAVVCNSYANQIGNKTRRGPGNVLVISPESVSYLKDCARLNNDDTITTHLHLCGTLSNTIKVLTSNLIPKDTILVGYKGVTSMDSGLIYCPKNLIVEKDLKMKDNETHMLSREDTFVFNNSEIVSGLDYYKTIKFKIEK